MISQWANTGGSGVGGIPPAKFVLGSQSTIIPTSCGGSGTPTFTRATTATVVDFEGRLVTVPSGATREQGARFVSNLCPTPSTTISVAGNKTITVSVGTFVFSMGAEATGTSLITFTGTATGSTGTLTANAANRTSKTLTITVGGTIIATCTVAAANNIQFEEVTGQSNQNPSEYVSVGVAASPYFGAGIDGAKWFPTQNGNTVSSNVVTEATGAALTTMKGYLSEPSATQILATADIRDMTTASWTLGATMTRARTSVGADGVASTANRLTGGAVAATNRITATTVAAATSRTYSALVKRVTGTGPVLITQDNFATSTDISSLLINGSYVLVSLTQSQLNAVYGFQVSTSTDAIDVDCNQFESGPVASSRMLATGAARNADLDSYATSGNIPASGAFVIAGEFTPNTTDTSAARTEWSTYTDASNYLSVYLDTTNGLQFERDVAASVTRAKIALTPAVGTTYKWSARYSPTTGLDIWLNGTKGTNNATTTQPVFAATMQYGAQNLLLQPYAALAALKIFARDLSDVQCAALSV